MIYLNCQLDVLKMSVDRIKEDVLLLLNSKQKDTAITGLNYDTARAKMDFKLFFTVFGN